MKIITATDIDGQLGQLGIEIRSASEYRLMQEYIRLLQEEIDITQRFINESPGLKKSNET